MSLKSLSVLCGVVLLASVGCGDSGTGGSGGGSAGGDTGGNPGTGGTPDTGGAPGDGGSPPEGGAPGDGGSGGAPQGADMSFDGSGFNPHNGQNLYVQVRDASDAVVASDTATIADGTFSFTFKGISATGGVVDYYADVNGDNACTTAGEPDHVWRENVPANNALVVTHNTNFSQEACDGF